MKNARRIRTGARLKWYRRMPAQAYCRTRCFRRNRRQHCARKLIYLLFFPIVFRED